MKNIFNKGHFRNLMTSEEIATQAQAILNQYIEKNAVKVFSGAGLFPEKQIWNVHQCEEMHTHQAYLICIEKIAECEHEVVSASKIFRDVGLTPYHYKCEKCGVKLKPTGWSAVDE